jgi:hypothetical protein
MTTLNLTPPKWKHRSVALAMADAVRDLDAYQASRCSRGQTAQATS